MPLRLALVVAASALLALGACSSDTKTVTATPTPTPAPTPTPTPTPTPPTVTLPAAAAMVFTTDRSITVETASEDSSVRRDRDRNRFRDVDGYRFTCLGAEACTWTITANADGAPTVEVEGSAKPGMVPSVRTLRSTRAAGAERFLNVRSGNWDAFELAAGANMVSNLVTVACAAGGEACDVQIERRVDSQGDETRYLVSRGGSLSFSRPDAQKFYDGLVYFNAGDNLRIHDPLELSMALGDQGGAAGWVRSAGNQGGTLSHIRTAPTGSPLAPAGSLWGNTWNSNTDQVTHIVDVTQTTVYETGKSGMFAGFKTGTASPAGYGASEAGNLRLGIEIRAVPGGVAGLTTPLADGSLTPGVAKGQVTWTVELPEKTGGSVAFADALTRDPDSMWTMGFVDEMRLGGDTADDMSDDGTLHYQLFTDHDVDKVADPAGNFGDFNAGATPGTVLVAGSSGTVPSAVPATAQTIPNTATNGTFNGVPGQFVCSAATCTVTRNSDGTQTLAGGNLAFTPSPGAQVYGDTDWLAIGSWALAMDNGATTYGAFFKHVAAFNDATLHTETTGRATYNGQARGHYAEFNRGARDSGVFAATAKFEANFGNTSQPGSISGTLRDFSTTTRGAETAVDRDAWEIDFGATADPSDPYTLDFTGSPNDSTGFVLGLGGQWGAGDDNGMEGTARFKFLKDSSAATYDQPTAIGGVFEATSEANDNYELSLIGAVGAKK